jgi:hypothetical protein
MQKFLDRLAVNGVALRVDQKPPKIADLILQADRLTVIHRRLFLNFFLLIFSQRFVCLQQQLGQRLPQHRPEGKA